MGSNINLIPLLKLILHLLQDYILRVTNESTQMSQQLCLEYVYSGPFASILGTLNPLQPSLLGSSGNVLFSGTSLGEPTDSLVGGAPLPYN